MPSKSHEPAMYRLFSIWGKKIRTLVFVCFAGSTAIILPNGVV